MKLVERKVYIGYEEENAGRYLRMRALCLEKNSKLLAGAETDVFGIDMKNNSFLKKKY